MLSKHAKSLSDNCEATELTYVMACVPEILQTPHCRFSVTPLCFCANDSVSFFLQECYTDEICSFLTLGKLKI